MCGHQNVDGNLQLLVDRKKLEHDARNQIRRQSLDPYNRLHSIAEDVEFVQSVHKKYARYPLLANLRCGSWYCDPCLANGITAHFKSADGHYNGWSFNLRRPNLHILPLIRDAGGICLVDSTRSGKRIPDSLSKTVPIWCTVVNRAMKRRGTVHAVSWDVQLYTPPQSVSKQEHTQIQSRVDDWTSSLAGSSYELPQLDKPLRPIWITPASTSFPSFDEVTPFSPVICISASKLVEDGAERRRNGYSYVQGAGDDHENWSEGLTPDIFWRYKDELLTAPEIDFPEILTRIVNEAPQTSRPLVKDRAKSPTSIDQVGGLLSISTLDDMPMSILSSSSSQTMSERFMPCIIVSVCPISTVETHTEGANQSRLVYEVMIPRNKKSGEHAFKACLLGCLGFIRQHVCERRQVCIACDTGTDLSVGIALVALQAFFDDNGSLDLNRFGRKDSQSTVTKESLRTRLHWIIASRPEANPSRATLKRINEFFMSPRYLDAQ